MMLPTLLRAHKDPFDRLIIATAIERGLTIVTSDEVFIAYPADVLQL
jgi:PIN domain nuclease of toxin-antitoxin system